MGLIHSFQAYIHTLTLHHIHFLKYDRDTTDCCCCSQSLWIPLQIRHTFISLHVQSSQPLQVLLLGTMLRFYCKFLQQLVLNSGLNREINKFVSYNLQQIIFKANILNNEKKFSDFTIEKTNIFLCIIGHAYIGYLVKHLCILSLPYAYMLMPLIGLRTSSSSSLSCP